LASLSRAFWHEARAEFGRLPVWLPGSPIALGDVGTFNRDTGWVKAAEVATLGIATEMDGPAGDVDYDYYSHDGAEVSLQLAAHTTAPPGTGGSGNAGLLVRFSRRGAFVLKARHVAIERITNIADLDRQVLELYRGGVWQRDWVVATEIARGGPAAIATSATAGAECTIDLGASPTVGGLAPVTIGAGSRVTHARGIAAHFLAPEPVALLWRGRCVHDRWWLAARMHERGDAEQVDEVAQGGSTSGDSAWLAEIEYPDDLPVAEE
jgi:hypothetical protein